VCFFLARFTDASKLGNSLLSKLRLMSSAIKTSIHY
jgi:hypothetical protein